MLVSYSLRPKQQAAIIENIVSFFTTINYKTLAYSSNPTEEIPTNKIIYHQQNTDLDQLPTPPYRQ